MQHPDRTRVIVTRFDTDNFSDHFERVGEAFEQRDAAGNPLFRNTSLWGTADGIGVIAPDKDPEPVFDPWFPGPGGTRFLLFSFFPKPRGAENVEHRAPEADDEGVTTGVPALIDHPEHPGKHISDTMDLVYVLSGEMFLELDRSEVHVKAGDVVIARGEWHNWRVETDEPCTILSVMVGAPRR